VLAQDVAFPVQNYSGHLLATGPLAIGGAIVVTGSVDEGVYELMWAFATGQPTTEATLWDLYIDVNPPFGIVPQSVWGPFRFPVGAAGHGAVFRMRCSMKDKARLRATNTLAIANATTTVAISLQAWPVLS
jgi:hypothetical protein